MSEATMLEVSVLVPVYNERDHLPLVLPVLLELLDANPAWEVIAVDDASIDGSRELLEDVSHERFRALHHASNRGKAAALRTALTNARGRVTAFQDADLEYEPRELAALTFPVLHGEVDACFGNRFLRGRPQGMRVQNYVANWGLSALTSALHLRRVPDMETCYKVVRTDLLRSLNLVGERFQIEPEITSKLLSRGASIAWKPISYSGRGTDEGKKIGTLDGVEAVVALIRCRLGFM